MNNIIVCGCTMHLKQYILNLVKKYGHSNPKTVSIPADISVKLKKNGGVSKEVKLSIDG